MPKITHLKLTKNGQRVNIYLDDAYAFTLEQSTLITAMLYQGKELTTEEIERYKQQDTYAYLFRRLLKFAMLRPRSQFELRRKAQELLEKGEGKGSGQEEEIMSAILERLDQQGFNDLNFARWWTDQRMAQAKYGLQKVRAELSAQKIDREIISQVLAPYTAEMDDKKKTVLQKKFGVKSLEEITNLKEKARAYRFLASRGF